MVALFDDASGHVIRAVIYKRNEREAIDLFTT
jgi:hypothetical protein